MISLLFFITSMPCFAGTLSADSTGLPGDNFSLEGALELFRKAESPEQFETFLNTENSSVNNLDLNGDGEIDYIRVIDKTEGDAHAFILQAIVSATENQDVAVIELEKNGADNAVLQIVGDEDIYGEPTIIEPVGEVKTNAGVTTSSVVVNVWTWPSVRYVYGRSYRVWVSPFAWQVRPAWWRPWRPVSYHIFRPYHKHYLPHYAVANTHRVVRAHRIYAPVRTTSVTVRTRHQVSVNHYRTTKTATKRTVSASGGNRQIETRKTTTVRGRSGNKKVKSNKTVKRKS